MTETNPLRVGFVGLGKICRSRHVPGLRRIDGVTITAVANSTPESTQQVAKELDIPHPCADWRTVVEHPEVDVVFIGTWPYMHREVTVAALNAGKHVFCQARMAMDYDDASAMYDAAREHPDLVTGVCPVPIGLAVDGVVHRLLREGTLGDIRLVRVHSLHDSYADPDAPMNWRKDENFSGLNMGMLGMFVEVVHRWFGWTDSVSAMGQTFVRERTDTEGNRRQVRIPDQFLCNTTVQAGFPVQYAFSTVARHGGDGIEVYGSKGSLRYTGWATDLQIAMAGDDTFQPVEARPGETYDVSHWRVEDDFIGAIRGGARYRPSFEDGLRYMQVIQAVYDASEQERVIHLA